MADNNKLIFVYGTLKSGGTLNDAMRRIGGTLYGVGRILSKNFVMRDLGAYPALQKVEPGSGDYILGELWVVPVDGISVLDEIENYPRFYNRTSVSVFTEGPQQTFPAIVYYIAIKADYGTREYLTQCPVIKSGEWDANQNMPVEGHSSEGEPIEDTREDTSDDFEYISDDTSDDPLDKSQFVCDKGVYITSEFGELFGPYEDIKDACNHITDVANELGADVRMMTVGFRVTRRDLDDRDLVDLDNHIIRL